MEDKFKYDQSEFIQEEIIEKRKNRKNTVLKLTTGALSGLLFGICAALAFHVTLDQREPVPETEKETESVYATEEHTHFWPEDLPKDSEELEAFVSGILEGNRKEEKSAVYEEISKIYEQASRSTVKVSAFMQDVDWFEMAYDSQASETGLVFKRDSDYYYILTGYDKLKDADSILVTTKNDEAVGAELMGYDKTFDIAVLKVGAENDNKRILKSLRCAGFGDMASILVADPVIAIGSVDGNASSFATGYVSEKVGTVGMADRAYDTLVTTVPVVSSDPVFIFGMNGKVYGYYGSASASRDSGYSESIEIADLLIYADRIVEGKTTCGFGITASDIPEAVKAAQEIPAGIYILSVKKDTDAYNAGIQAGDVISAIDKDEVLSMEDYDRILSELDPEEEAVIKVFRSSQGSYKERSFRAKPYLVQY